MTPKTIESAELEACPLCGAPATIQSSDTDVKVRCTTCHCRVSIQHYATSDLPAIDQATRAWNRRSKSIGDAEKPPIKGYRQLSLAEVGLVNKVKEFALKTGQLVEDVQAQARLDNHPEAARWAAMAKSDMQKGFMALIRSITRPEGF